MKQLIEYIVSNIVNHPESVVISEEQTEDKEATKYLIKVDPEDVGRVIGKQGKVIKSIRQIVRIAAIQKGTRAIVDLLEDGIEAKEEEPVKETEDLVEEKEEALEEVAEVVEEAKEEEPVKETEELAEEKKDEEAE
ncbi:MAG TPA: KH domain-containing protein [Candidatus Woesebacteria bacterium]|nr:KH domain-containing protein [Candidatus Woesebacteria bacterium]